MELRGRCRLFGQSFDHLHAAVEVGIDGEHQGVVGDRLDQLGTEILSLGRMTTAGCGDGAVGRQRR